jgi:hypothetical protein
MTRGNMSELGVHHLIGYCFDETRARAGLGVSVIRLSLPPRRKFFCLVLIKPENKQPKA